MTPGVQQERSDTSLLRQIADQAFSRAAGAPLLENNSVRILKNAKENYPAWLDAIRSARKRIYFESYIIHDDDTGRLFADALIAKAHEGVRVCLIYDWVGALGKTPRRFWRRLSDGGVEVRCYNPPQLDSPLGWVSRDHRKMLSADGEVGFVAGLCVGSMWVGDPARNIDPWRDTGVEVRGAAVAAIDNAFTQVWQATGAPPLPGELAENGTNLLAGDIGLRVIATVPNTAGLFRLDQLVASFARQRLWLTDAYYAGTTPYVQALRAAARDDVDVRLLVPDATDIPILRPLSRAGYRPLLEAGIRVFEWNGTMLHAKTAVADGRWSRIGSTNLNLQSWLGNYELDVMVEDERFAKRMEEMYVQDLDNATEIVVDDRCRISRVPTPAASHRSFQTSSGSAGRATAGALRVGNAIGAAISNHRVLEPVEARIMTGFGLLLLCLCVVVVLLPQAIIYPFVLVTLWLSLALLYRGYKLRRSRAQEPAGTGGDNRAEDGERRSAA